MLQFKLDSLDGLDESVASLYTQKDGAYFLNVSGAISDGEVAALRANRDEILAEKREQQRLRDAAEAERLRIEREANEEAARKAGDWQALEDSYKTKLSEKEAQFIADNDALRKQVYKLTVGDQALKLASEISKPHAQAILTRFIEERLTLDESGVVRVLDLQGKPSAMTIEDLKTEFKANAMFQDIVVVNNSTGGGATGGGFGGGAAKNPKDMTADERAEWSMKDPIGFQTAVKQGKFK